MNKCVAEQLVHEVLYGVGQLSDSLFLPILFAVDI